jgi:hypothetical protein
LLFLLLLPLLQLPFLPKLLPKFLSLESLEKLVSVPGYSISLHYSDSCIHGVLVFCIYY